MKKAIAILILAATLVSCGQSHYSPMDTYIQARISGDSLNEASRAEAQQYIDSVKGAHIIIHMQN